METTKHGWTILDQDAGVLSYNYAFAKDGATANSFAMRMKDGKMAVISPPVDPTDGVLSDLAEFGDVGALVANNGFHHLGQASWKTQFPEARSFAAPEAAVRIRAKSKTAGEFEPIVDLQPLLADGTHYTEAPATKCGEGWTWAKTASGNIWFGSDILMNMPKLPPSFIMGKVFKWTKSAPGFCVFGLALKFTVKDRTRVLRLFQQQAQEHAPAVIVPGHGDILRGPDLAARTDALITSRL